MRRLILISCSVVAVSTLACAESERVGNWLEADEDGDGALSEAETSGPMKRFFSRNDADGDGKLTREELVALDKRLGARGANRPVRGRAVAIPEGVIGKKDQVYREGHDQWKADVYLPEAEAPAGGRPGMVIVHGG